MKDPYIDPVTKILRNKLGLTNAADLAQAKNAIATNRARELDKNPVESNFDRAHLEAIHEHLFGQVYDWAGTARSIPVRKAEAVLGGDTVKYPSPLENYGLDERLQYSFDRLAADNHLKGLADDPDRFAERFARNMVEIWECHEFREGNTRTTTAFFRQLAKEAGYELSPEFPQDSRSFRDSLALAAARDDYTRLNAHIETGLDLASRREHGVVQDPTVAEFERAESRLAAETERRIEALQRIHDKAVAEPEARRDAAREAHDSEADRLAARGRRKPNDRERLELRGLHRAKIDTEIIVENRRDDFTHGRVKRENDVRTTVGKSFPEYAATVRRGLERRSFDAAVELWHSAEKALEAAPEDRRAQQDLSDSVSRLRESAPNRARLDADQRSKIEDQHAALERDRSKGAVPGQGPSGRVVDMPTPGALPPGPDLDPSTTGPPPDRRTTGVGRPRIEATARLPDPSAGVRTPSERPDQGSPDRVRFEAAARIFEKNAGGERSGRGERSVAESMVAAGAAYGTAADREGAHRLSKCHGSCRVSRPDDSPLFKEQRQMSKVLVQIIDDRNCSAARARRRAGQRHRRTIASAACNRFPICRRSTTPRRTR